MTKKGGLTVNMVGIHSTVEKRAKRMPDPTAVTTKREKILFSNTKLFMCTYLPLFSPSTVSPIKAVKKLSLQKFIMLNNWVSVRIVENPQKYESSNPSNKGHRRQVRECALSSNLLYFDYIFVVYFDQHLCLHGRKR